MIKISDKSKSFADSLKSYHVDDSTTFDTKPNNFGKKKSWGARAKPYHREEIKP